MNEAWNIGVFFKMFSNAKSVLGETTAAAKEANAQMNQHGKAMQNAGASAKAAGKDIESAAGSITRAGQAAERSRNAYASLGSALKSVSTAGSYVALATAAVGVKGAADLQDAYTRIGVQNGRTGPQIDKQYTDMLLKVSNRTGMSLSDVLGVSTEVSGVIKDQKELATAIGGNGKGGIADLVNVLHRSGASKASSDEIAKQVVTIDHILNAYTGPAMAHVNDRLMRAVVGSHMDLGTLERQVGYFGEQYRLAGGTRKGSVDDILKLSELGYWGVGTGKWGAGFGQILRSLDHPTKMSTPALEAFGIIDKHGHITSSTENEKGEFTPMAMIEEARKRTQGMTPMAIQKLVNDLPSNAARMFAEALSPKTQGFIARLDASQGNMMPLMDMQAQFMGNLNEQTERLTENFKNFAAQLAAPWIQTITTPFKALADFFGKSASWLHDHPNQAKLAGAGLGIAAIPALIGLAKASGNFLGVGLAIAKDGPRARIFGGHHLMHHAGDETAELASRSSGLVGDVLEHVGNFVFMRSTRSELGKIFAPRGPGSSVMGVGGDFMRGVRSDAVAGIKGLPGVSQVGEVFSKVAGYALKTRAPLEFVAELIGRVGLRAIPVVGEVLMLIDTIKFLGAHSKDIGKIIADVAHWITHTGGPMLWKAFTDVVSWIASGIKDTFMGIFNGGHGGIWDAIRNGVQAFGDENRRLDANDRHQGRSATAITHNNGHATIHNEIHVHTDSAHPKEHAELIMNHIVNMSGQALRSISNHSGIPSMSRLEVGRA